jgi:hypothetical protein
MRFLTVVFVFLCISSISSFGQKVLHQQQHWVRYQNQIVFSDRVYWNNEIDNRRFIDPDQQFQLIMHSRVHLKKDRWDFAGGLTTSWAYTAIAEVNVQHPTFEVRPVLEASYEISFSKFLLQQRIRVDNRFFEEDRFDNLFGTYEYVARFRYRIQARAVVRKDQEGKPIIGLRLADEIMVNHKSNFFDQHRIALSCDLKVSSRFNMELGYINIYQQRRGGGTYYNRDVLRLSLLHTINL